MRELHGERGPLRELADGRIVVELVMPRATAATLFALALGAPVVVSVRAAVPAPQEVQAPVQSAPAQTISTTGKEELVLGVNSPARPADRARLTMIHTLLNSPRFQEFAWLRSGLSALPPDSVQHASEWLLKQCRVDNPLALLSGEPAARADALFAEFRSTVTS